MCAPVFWQHAAQTCGAAGLEPGLLARGTGRHHHGWRPAQPTIPGTSSNKKHTEGYPGPLSVFPTPPTHTDSLLCFDTCFRPVSPTSCAQYRKFEINIPRKGIARPQSQISTFMCLWAIYLLSVCLFCCRKICGQILGIYKLLTDA
jgi:hypothetical protein